MANGAFPTSQMPDASVIASALAHRYLPPSVGCTFVATADLSDANLEWLRAHHPETSIVFIPHGEFVAEAEERFGLELADAATNALARVRPSLSAHTVVSGPQIAALVLGVCGVIATIAYSPNETFQTLATILSLSFLAGTIFRAVLAYIGARAGATKDAPRPDELPIYTILVPLYREANVLPRLARALLMLDYPDMLAQREKKF